MRLIDLDAKEPYLLDGRYSVDVVSQRPYVHYDFDETAHGHWVGIDDEPCETFECDRCGYILETTGKLYNYCPNCGANMMEDEDEGSD